MFFRRSKYMDFFICALFIVLLVYAYFSRRVLLDKLRREEEERLKLEHSANSLKEELKIVYYHTSKLEEALKAEQDRHRSTTSRLSTQSQDFKVNMTLLQKQYTIKLKEKSESISAYMRENDELREKQKTVEKHFVELAEEHKLVAAKVKLEYDALKQKKDGESMRLQDQIQETYNQKVYFQKKALLNEEDYKKTLKKLVRCRSILGRKNATRVSHKASARNVKRNMTTKVSFVTAPAESHVTSKKFPDAEILNNHVKETESSESVQNIPVASLSQTTNVSLTEEVLPNRYNLNSNQELNASLTVEQSSNNVSSSRLAENNPTSNKIKHRMSILVTSAMKPPGEVLQKPKLPLEEKYKENVLSQPGEENSNVVASNSSLVNNQANQKSGISNIDLQAT